MKKISTSIEKTALLFFLCSFLVITIFKVLGLILVALCVIFYLINMLYGYRILLRNEDLIVIIIFYLLPFIFIGFSIVSVFICDKAYIDTYLSRMGRLLNMVIYLIVFIFLINRKNKRCIDTGKALNCYLLGCYCLIFFGIWQLLNSIFGIPYIEFKTRNYLHSMDADSLLPFMQIRITSIAEEPAYLIPYLMDAAIIIYYQQKKKAPLCLILIILFFTLSLSGYMNLFFVFFCVIFFMPSIKKIYTGIILVPCSIYVLYKISPVVSAVLTRLNPDFLLKSDRLQEILLPLNYMFTEASFFNLVFGFGSKGIIYVCEFLTYTGSFRKLNAEPHFFLASYFVEYGMIGLFIGIFFFIYLLSLAKKTFVLTGNRLSQVLSFNLIITSLYTADYASPRFTVIILLILYLYKDARYNVNEKNRTS